MNASPQSPLFNLIKSLSKSEKRHFKVFAAKHALGGSNLYVVLFDKMEAQNQYDEASILKNEKRIHKKSLHSLKHYLYELILKSLEAFHHETGSVEAAVLTMLLRVDILVKKKSLYPNAKKILLKAKALAHEAERFHLLPAILEMETNLLKMYSDPRDYYSLISDLFVQRRKAKAALELIQVYDEVQTSIAVRWNEVSKKKSRRDIAFFDKLNRQYLTAEYKNFSVSASYFYFVAKMTYFVTRNESKNASNWAARRVEILEANPLVTNENPRWYLNAVNDWIATLMPLGQWNHINNAVVRLNNAKNVFQAIGRSTHLQAQFFTAFYNSVLQINIQAGQPEKNTALFSNVEVGLKQYAPFINKNIKVALEINLSIALLILKKYKRSLAMVNDILTDSEEGVIEANYSITKILQLMIHYELGNFTFLEHQIRSTHRYLKRTRRFSEVERIIFKYFRKIIKSEMAEKTQEYFIHFLKEINSVVTDPLQRTFVESVYLQLWIKSKIENIEFARVIERDLK